jgi:hypothetical protein
MFWPNSQGKETRRLMLLHLFNFVSTSPEHSHHSFQFKISSSPIDDTRAKQALVRAGTIYCANHQLALALARFD